MASSSFALVVDGVITPIYTVSTMGFGGAQSVIVYESAGTNGGTVVTTGRTNKEVSLSGKILHQADTTLNDIQLFFQKVRDQAKVVQLLAPVDNGDTGSYIIKDFNPTIIEGTPSYLLFTMTLTEYRQANIQTRTVNLVNFGPADELRQRLVDTNKAEAT